MINTHNTDIVLGQVVIQSTQHDMMQTTVWYPLKQGMQDTPLLIWKIK